jgi:hypothetical protein
MISHSPATVVDRHPDNLRRRGADFISGRFGLSHRGLFHVVPPRRRHAVILFSATAAFCRVNKKSPRPAKILLSPSHSLPHNRQTR